MPALKHTRASLAMVHQSNAINDRGLMKITIFDTYIIMSFKRDPRLVQAVKGLGARWNGFFWTLPLALRSALELTLAELALERA